MKMKPILTLSLCASLAAFSTLAVPQQVKAGELNPSHLPSDTQWVLHVNFEEFSDSGLARHLREQKPELTGRIHEWFRNEYGIDPPQEFHSLTMFSRDYKRYTGTVIVQAAYDRSKVMAKMEQAGKMKTTEWQNHTLHTVTIAKHQEQPHNTDRKTRRDSDRPGHTHDHSGGKQMTIAFVDDDTIVVGSSVPNAQAALRLLSGDAKSLANDSPLLSDRVDKAWLYGAAINLQQLEQHLLAMPVLQQHECITWSFGDRDGRLFEHAKLVGRSEQVAEQMHKVIEGIVAYETLWSEGSQPMKDLMKNTQIRRDGNVVEVNWDGDTDTVLAALNDIGKRLQQLKHVWQPNNRNGS